MTSPSENKKKRRIKLNNTHKWSLKFQCINNRKYSFRIRWKPEKKIVSLYTYISSTQKTYPSHNSNYSLFTTVTMISPSDMYIHKFTIQFIIICILFNERYENILNLRIIKLYHGSIRNERKRRNNIPKKIYKIFISNKICSFAFINSL